MELPERIGSDDIGIAERTATVATNGNPNVAGLARGGSR